MHPVRWKYLVWETKIQKYTSAKTKKTKYNGIFIWDQNLSRIGWKTKKLEPYKVTKANSLFFSSPLDKSAPKSSHMTDPSDLWATCQTRAVRRASYLFQKNMLNAQSQKPTPSVHGPHQPNSSNYKYYHLPLNYYAPGFGQLNFKQEGNNWVSPYLEENVAFFCFAMNSDN